MYSTTSVLFQQLCGTESQRQSPRDQQLEPEVNDSPIDYESPTLPRSWALTIIFFFFFLFITNLKRPWKDNIKKQIVIPLLVKTNLSKSDMADSTWVRTVWSLWRFEQSLTTEETFALERHLVNNLVTSAQCACVGWGSGRWWWRRRLRLGLFPLDRSARQLAGAEKGSLYPHLHKPLILPVLYGLP